MGVDIILKLVLSVLIIICGYGLSSVYSDDYLNWAGTARMSGLGNNGVVVDNDISSILINPAVLCFIDQTSLEISSFRLKDFSSITSVMYGAEPNIFSNWGISLVRLESGSYDRRDRFNVKSGTFEVGDLALSGSYAYRFARDISVGLSLGYLSKQVDNCQDSVVSIGAGAIWQIFPALNLGASIRNAYVMDLNTSIHNPYPQRIAIGSSYRMMDDFLLIAGLEWVDYQTLILNVGGEYSLGDILFFRSSFVGSQLGVGVGITFGGLKIDYALIQRDLDFVHKLSFGFDWGQTRNSKSNRLSNQLLSQYYDHLDGGRYQEAQLEIHKYSQLNRLTLEESKQVERIKELNRDDVSGWLKKIASPRQKRYVTKGFSKYIQGKTIESKILLKYAVLDGSNIAKLWIYLEKLGANRMDDDIITQRLKEIDGLFYELQDKEVIRICEEVLKFDSNLTIFTERMGSSYYRMGNYKKAKDLWLRAIPYSPNAEDLRWGIDQIDRLDQQ